MGRKSHKVLTRLADERVRNTEQNKQESHERRSSGRRSCNTNNRTHSRRDDACSTCDGIMMVFTDDNSTQNFANAIELNWFDFFLFFLHRIGRLCVG